MVGGGLGCGGVDVVGLGVGVMVREGVGVGSVVPEFPGVPVPFGGIFDEVAEGAGAGAVVLPLPGLVFPPSRCGGADGPCVFCFLPKESEAFGADSPEALPLPEAEVSLAGAVF